MSERDRLEQYRRERNAERRMRKDAEAKLARVWKWRENLRGTQSSMDELDAIFDGDWHGEQK